MVTKHKTSKRKSEASSGPYVVLVLHFLPRAFRKGEARSRIVFIISPLLVMLFVSVPIFMALSVAALVSMLMFTGMDPMILAQRMFGWLDKFSLMSMFFHLRHKPDGYRRPFREDTQVDRQLCRRPQWRAGLHYTVHLHDLWRTLRPKPCNGHRHGTRPLS